MSITQSDLQIKFDVVVTEVCPQHILQALTGLAIHININILRFVCLEESKFCIKDENVYNTWTVTPENYYVCVFSAD